VKSTTAFTACVQVAMITWSSPLPTLNCWRGNAGAADTVLRVADLEMDLLSRTVRRAGQALELQPREFRLLEYLMRHAGQVVTRTMLLEGVWDYHFDPQTNVIDVHISRLRGKIDKGFDPALLRTVRGAGYSLGAR
jgi:two-component system OmpR family response regulator